MAVLDALERKRDFTATEVELANYILQHQDEVTEMNIGELSKAAFTSNATVVRLCRKLGVEGYRDFRISLAREIELRRNHVLDVNPDTPFFEGQGAQEVMRSIANLAKQAIDACQATVSAHDVRRAAKLVMGARRVALYAIGDSLVSAEMFENLMLKLGVVSYSANRRGDANSVSHALGPQDVAVIITYHGTMLNVLSSELDVLFSRGCKAIVITASPWVRERFMSASCTILLPDRETRAGRVATFFSQECIRYVLNCIYAECFAMNYEMGIALRDHIEGNVTDPTTR